MDKNQLAERQLIKQFYGFAKSICQRYGANEEEVEEMINDGFLKMFNNLHKYDAKQPFKAWLRTIMTNGSIDYYRKQHKFSLHIGLENAYTESIDEDLISSISAQEILALVQKLPPSYRMVFTMYVVEGYNHREIGELLGVQEGTSKSNLAGARQKLQEMIRHYSPQLYASYSSNKRKANES